MKFKVPLPAFPRREHQTPSILKNRYAIEVNTGEGCKHLFSVVHEALWASSNEWSECYSWWILGRTSLPEEWTEETPDKSYLGGLIKRYDDYYDGPIITWILGPVMMNYRW